MKNWKILLISFALVANTSFAAPQVLDEVAAVVNNGVVLESDVNNMVQSIRVNVQQTGQQLPDEATLRRQILDKLIMDQIILQMGQRMGLQVTDQQVDQAISNVAQQNHVSEQQLQASLISQGLSLADYRKQIRQEIIITEVRNDQVRELVNILPQEVDSLAEQLAGQNSASTELNLSHILIPLPENPTQQQVQEAQSKAQMVAEQAHAGADFAKLAITWSADPQALHGGKLGWTRIEELPGTFAQALTTAKKDDIIGPLPSGVGFHILKVNDLRGQSQSVSVTEIHARHILIKTSPIMTDVAATQELQQIAAGINSGKISFADAAKKYSQDPGSASKGGDLGWTNPNSFDPAFRDALFKLQKNQISAPVHSSFGWHLIELLGSRTVDKTDAALKDRAYRIIFNRKFSEAAASWMQQQRDSAYVKILNN